MSDEEQGKQKSDATELKPEEVELTEEEAVGSKEKPTTGPDGKKLFHPTRAMLILADESLEQIKIVRDNIPYSETEGGIELLLGCSSEAMCTLLTIVKDRVDAERQLGHIVNSVFRSISGGGKVVVKNHLGQQQKIDFPQLVANAVLATMMQMEQDMKIAGAMQGGGLKMPGR